jgi:predicted nucleotide-binding protein
MGSEMSARNPYHASRPGNLFTGEELLRRRIVDGLANGKSFAVAGGRRCGKTSLLLQIAKDLEAETDETTTFLPRLLDIQGEIPHSPAEFFGSLASLLTQGTSLDAWRNRDTSQPAYQSFLAWAQCSCAGLSTVHGPHWVCVFLIDELEVAAGTLPSDECFHNLRHLLMTSPLASRVRTVVSGTGALSRLIGRGSPLNNLEPEALSFLADCDAKALMAAGFDAAMSIDLQTQLIALTGGHPWILQAVLGYLWDQRATVDADSIASAVRRFVRDRDDVFVTWIKSFGGAGQDAFGFIARANQPVRSRELRAVLPADSTVDGVLRVLGYHGVIVESADGGVLPNGTVFKDWFQQNVAYVKDDADPRPDQVAAPAQESQVPSKKRRVFIVFGRDRKLHSSVVRFLRTLKLEPVEWNSALEATRNGSATIREILDQAFSMAQAVVVLLTPDDEARLRPVFHGEQEPEHEKNYTPQPRPNVIFEAGFAMANFPASTILVRFDKRTRLFSDIGGVFLLDLSNDFNARQDFVRRLKICGLDVDDSGTEWHTKEQGGDFTPAD